MRRLVCFAAAVATAVALPQSMKTEWEVCTYEKGRKTLAGKEEIGGKMPKKTEPADSFTNSYGVSEKKACSIAVMENGKEVKGGEMRWKPKTTYEIVATTNMPDASIGWHERTKKATDECTRMTKGAGVYTDYNRTQTRTFTTGRGSPREIVAGITCDSRAGEDVYYDNVVMLPPERTFDYVVVGSGPGGLAAAQLLAAQGNAVAVLERGQEIDNKYYKSMPPAFTGMSCGHATDCAPMEAHVDAHFSYSAFESEIEGGLTFSRWGGQQTYNGAVYAPAKADADVAPCAAQAVKWHVPDHARKYNSHFDSRAPPRGVTAWCDKKDTGTCTYGDMNSNYDATNNVRRSTVSQRIKGMPKHMFKAHTGVNVKHIVVENGDAVGVIDSNNHTWHTSEKGKVVLAAGALGTAKLVCESGGEDLIHNGFSDVHNHFFMHAAGEPTKHTNLWFETFEVDVTHSSCKPTQVFEMQLAGTSVNDVSFIVLMQMQPETRFGVHCGENNVPQLTPSVTIANCDGAARATAIDVANALLENRLAESIAQADGTIQWHPHLRAWHQGYHWGGGIAGRNFTASGIMAADASMVAKPHDAHMSLQAASAGIRAAMHEIHEDWGREHVTKACSAAGFMCANMCCKAMTASCLACAQCTTPHEFCKKPENRRVHGCKEEADKEKKRQEDMAQEKGVEFARVQDKATANASGYGGIEYDMWQQVTQGSGSGDTIELPPDVVVVDGDGEEVLVLAPDNTTAETYNMSMWDYISQLPGIDPNSNVAILEATYHVQHTNEHKWYSDDIAQSHIDITARIAHAFEEGHPHQIVAEGTAACAWMQAATAMDDDIFVTQHLIHPECPEGISAQQVYDDMMAKVNLAPPFVYPKLPENRVNASSMVGVLYAENYDHMTLTFVDDTGEQAAQCSALEDDLFDCSQADCVHDPDDNFQISFQNADLRKPENFADANAYCLAMCKADHSCTAYTMKTAFVFASINLCYLHRNEVLFFGGANQKNQLCYRKRELQEIKCSDKAGFDCKQAECVHADGDDFEHTFSDPNLHMHLNFDQAHAKCLVACKNDNTCTGYTIKKAAFVFAITNKCILHKGEITLSGGADQDHALCYRKHKQTTCQNVYLEHDAQNMHPQDTNTHQTFDCKLGVCKGTAVTRQMTFKGNRDDATTACIRRCSEISCTLVTIQTVSANDQECLFYDHAPTFETTATGAGDAVCYENEWARFSAPAQLQAKAESAESDDKETDNTVMFIVIGSLVGVTFLGAGAYFVYQRRQSTGSAHFHSNFQKQAFHMNM